MGAASLLCAVCAEADQPPSGADGAAARAAKPNAWITTGRADAAAARAAHPIAKPAKNVVLFVGDGMGMTTIVAARILAGQLRGEPGEENRLSFERFPHVALAKTYNTNQQTPDSAGTMTALVTGAKTRAGVLSVDESVERGDFAAVGEHRLTTLVELAEDRGLSTGFVTTTTITHATPAALYAHAPDRGWENDGKLSAGARAANFPDIARQLVEFDRGDGIEVALGGGAKNFFPVEGTGARDFDHSLENTAADHVGSRADGRDLAEEWLALRPRSVLVETCEQLSKLPENTEHLLGLFSPSHMEFEADRAKATPCQPSLTAMTASALSILRRNPRGFVLVVEGGRIDHGHHVNNAYRALTDTIEFARAVELVARETSPDDTLIVVTADHGHVFTIAGYAKRGNDILGLVIGNDEKGNPSTVPTPDGAGRPFTALGYANGPGYTGSSDEQPEGPKHFPHNAKTFEGIHAGRPSLTNEQVTDPDYLQEATVPFYYESHSAEDVPVYARGPGAALFDGVREQSYVFHAVIEALGWAPKQTGK